MNPKLIRVCEPGDELRDSSGLRLLFVETPSASAGRRLEMEWHVPPGRRLVAADHYHLDGPERWTVLEGAAGYRLDGAEHSASAPHGTSSRLRRRTGTRGTRARASLWCAS